VLGDTSRRIFTTQLSTKKEAQERKEQMKSRWSRKTQSEDVDQLDAPPWHLG
jgi:hypothetical protein